MSSILPTLEKMAAVAQQIETDSDVEIEDASAFADGTIDFRLVADVDDDDVTPSGGGGGTIKR